MPLNSTNLDKNKMEEINFASEVTIVWRYRNSIIIIISAIQIFFLGGAGFGSSPIWGS